MSRFPPDTHQAEDAMSFWDHAEELRRRLWWMLVGWVLGAIVCFQISDPLLRFMTRPVGPLVFTSPAGAFQTRFFVAVFAGLFLALPWILFQMWRFIGSALTEHERLALLVGAPLSLGLFLTGAVFAWGVLVPVSLRFLLGFATEVLQPLITVDKYLGFLSGMVLAGGLVFETPLVLFILARIGVATPAFLRQKRRWAVVMIFVLAAVITPPDVISQIMLALPLLILYEAGILAAAAAQSMRVQKEK